MSRGNKDLLRHIIGYCNQIEEANKQFGNSYDLFCSNSVYRNAVAMCVLQIVCGFKKSQTFYRQNTENSQPIRHDICIYFLITSSAFLSEKVRRDFALKNPQLLRF